MFGRIQCFIVDKNQDGSMRIMLVEDNPRIRKTIRELILREVQDVNAVLECGDGADAVEQYPAQRPDWVLMDIAMDRMDGLAASTKILRDFPKARIMIVTQYDDPDYRDAAREIGVHAYVLKDNLMDIPVLLKNTLR